MNLKQTSLSLLDETLLKAIHKYAKPADATQITDIHVMANGTTGELSVMDDDDKTIAQEVIPEWCGFEGDFYAEVEPLLKERLQKFYNNRQIDKMKLLRPFSFVLIDEEKESVSELLLVDDDTVIISDTLLKGLDEELDEFINKLLAE